MEITKNKTKTITNLLFKIQPPLKIIKKHYMLSQDFFSFLARKKDK